MSTERRKILDMLAAGKINAAEADELLTALDSGARSGCCSTAEGAATERKKPKFLCVRVNPKSGYDEREQVNIRIPVMLIKAGLKLKGLMPGHAHDKIHHALHAHGFDVDLSKMDSESIDSLLQALTEMSIDVDSEKETVRVCCE